MSDADHTAEHTPGLFHRLVDWSIFPASVAASCTVGVGLLFGVLDAVTGRRTANTEILQAAAGVLSAATAAVLTKRRI